MTKGEVTTQEIESAEAFIRQQFSLLVLLIGQEGTRDIAERFAQTLKDAGYVTKVMRR